MGVLDETQEERDIELCRLTGVPLEKIKSYEIAAPDNIAVYQGMEEPKDEEDYLALYKEYKYLNLTGYLKTLMFTSVHSRGDKLLKILRGAKDQVCLDFGSGVGTHTIALLENGNRVDILDVVGPLVWFAILRIGRDKIGVYQHSDELPENKYDLVICADVLEHCFDPMKELERIRVSMKKSGRLFLEVSDMVKPSSGHFPQSITKWKSHEQGYIEKYFEPDYNAGMLIKK